MKKAQGQPTRHGRHDLWLNRGYLPQLEAGTQQHGGRGGQEGMICGIHTRSGQWGGSCSWCSWCYVAALGVTLRIGSRGTERAQQKHLHQN